MAASPITANVQQVLATAALQRGISESPPFSNRTKFSTWYGLIGPWCAMFVSWVFWHAGFRLPAIRTAKGFAYCPDIVNYARRHGIWHGTNVRPRPGWIVLFDFPGDGVNRPSHVGILERVLPDGRLSVWEGNTSGGGGRDGGSVVNHFRRISGGVIGYVQVDDVIPAGPAGVIMGPGSSGPAVRFWQAILNVLARYRVNAHGRRGGARILEDGQFGPQTVEATRELQRFVNQFVTYIGKPHLMVSVNGKVTRALADSAADWVKVAQRKGA
jgi:peptidoglycan hydrolase-like protein with peptidoglycan-binding domain